MWVWYAGLGRGLTAPSRAASYHGPMPTLSTCPSWNKDGRGGYTGTSTGLFSWGSKRVRILVMCAHRDTGLVGRSNPTLCETPRTRWDVNRWTLDENNLIRSLKYGQSVFAICFFYGRDLYVYMNDCFFLFSFLYLYRCLNDYECVCQKYSFVYLL